MKFKIGFITLQGKKSLSTFEAYLKIMKVLEPLSTDIAWVATNYLGDEKRLPTNVTLIKLEAEDIDKAPFIKKALHHLWREMKIVFRLRKLRDIDLFMFYCGYVPLFPILYTTLFMRKKTVLRIEGRSSVELKIRMSSIDLSNRWIRMIIYSFIEKLAYSLVSKIAVEYESMVEFYQLQKYQQKIALANQYIDTALFKPAEGLRERSYLLGYFGRLSYEKGVLELARALSLILKDGKSRAIIVGDGDLHAQVESILKEHVIQGHVQLVRWVLPDKMPAYLNDTVIAVIPSYGEGMPNIMLEAMACGTVVLATAVGGIPDLIKDGETGFILEDNSPECIARNISRVLNHPHLGEITRKARALVEKEYAYEVVLERYRNIISGR
jgi:glycosyltransferase involved in cell wall biosynthesis